MKWNSLVENDTTEVQVKRVLCDQQLHKPSPPAVLEVLIVHFLLSGLALPRYQTFPVVLGDQLNQEDLDPPEIQSHLDCFNHSN